MKIGIYRANHKDIESLLKLDTVVPIDLSRIELIKKWAAAGDCYIAKADNKIVGYAVLNYQFFHMGNVDMLMIHPDFRRKGIGQALLRYLMALCKTNKFWVTTNQSNKPMQQLLEKEGFVRSGIIENIDEGDPELVFMQKINTVALKI